MKAILTLLMLTAEPASLIADQPIVHPFESDVPITTNNRIDGLVYARLKQLGIQPANSCSDQVFIRRVYLDVIGTLPEAEDVQLFLRDRSSDKRAELIDQLLERDEFADYWAVKWCDLLRVKAEFPINLWPNAVQAYHRWIRTAVAENMPYDRFVRELLTSNGSNFRVAPVNFYRALQNREPRAIAQAVALTFMGSRSEAWPQDRQAGVAACFSRIGYKETGEWKEEIVFFDSLRLSTNADDATTEALPVCRSRDRPTTSSTNTDDATTEVVLPDGTKVQLLPDRDPRQIFADWLITPENPWFARNIVNRVWTWLLGRGIVAPPDDLRPDNPPSNPELLAWLERELVKTDYDLKHIYRLILNSRTYQLSSIPRSEHPDAAANFACYPLRRLDAEVLIDALCQITGTTEEYSSPRPEPFTFIPEDQRSIALADGSISSPFLEMFGRPSRDTGLESERNNQPTAAQRLHMLNSSHIRTKVEQSPRLRALMQARRAKPRAILQALYLTILSRYPTAEEGEVLQKYAQSGEATGPEVLQDLVWALINSAEFMYRH